MLQERRDHERQRKLAALYAMALNYGREFPRPLARLWMRLLDPYSAEQVEEGVARVVNEYEYKTLPPFAVLRKAMDRASGALPPERALDMLAEAEWHALLDAVRGRGRYNPPAFHPTTAYVLRGMGGWNAACDWETEKLEWRRGRFMDAWKLAHDNIEAMSLGARGVEAMAARSGGYSPAGALAGRAPGIAAGDTPGAER